MASKSDNTCPVCVKSVLDTDSGVGCDGACRRWFHRECITMSKAEYQRISADNKIKWYCSRTDCVQPSDQPLNLILKQLTLLTSKISDIGDKVDSLTSLPAKVDSLVCEVEALNKNLSQLDARLSANEAKVTALENKLVGAERHDGYIEPTIAEISERTRRSKNVMLFNFPESQDRRVDARRKHDNELVSLLLNTVIPAAGDVTFATARVGKSIPNKTRPLKIILSDESMVVSFLSNFSSDSAALVDQGLSGVKASRDRTPRELEYFKSLKSEMELRSSKGEKDLCIRYRNNVPYITKNKKNA